MIATVAIASLGLICVLLLCWLWEVSQRLNTAIDRLRNADYRETAARKDVAYLQNQLAQARARKKPAPRKRRPQ